jgi:peptidoglycan/xylan/chitin deacetylase (PgdA/CDA1 family)
MPLSWQAMKGLVRQGMAETLYLSNLHRFCHKGKAAILTYHRVVPRDELSAQWIQPGMYVETDVFERHMLFLQEEFRIISLHELLERWNTGDWDKEARYCVVTFDDGWLDNYLYAYPILRKFGIPATIFLPTDFVGTHEWFWPEKVAYCVNDLTRSEEASVKGGPILNEFLGIDADRTRLSYVSDVARRDFADHVIERCKEHNPKAISELVDKLSNALGIILPHKRCIVDWTEVAVMAQGRISFGSHSCSHRILTHLSAHDVKSELEESQQVLMARSKNYVPVFCYPNGNNTARIQAMVKECGYQAAVGVQPGVEGASPSQLFELRRISIHNDIAYTVPLYAMRLSMS